MTKRIILGAFVTISYIFLSLQSVLAWGPERPTYTMDSPAKSATFNSITDNAAIGDERDFVRIVEVRNDGKRNTYTNELDIEAGKDYEVYIYYHNDASSTYNTKKYDYRGVAYNTRLSTTFPDSLKAGEQGMVYGALSSTSTTPEKVWDEAKITAKEDVTLHYVLASAKISNDWGASGRGLSTNLFSQKGTFIGLNELNGMIFGCDEYSGFITYKIRTLKPGEFEAQQASEVVTSNEKNSDDEESMSEETVSENAKTVKQIGDPKKSIHPVILVCAGVVAGMIITKVINTKRKK